MTAAAHAPVAARRPAATDWRAAPLFGRLLLAATLLIAFGVLQGARLVEGCLPAYRAAIRHLADEFRVVRLALDREGADRVVRAEVALRPVVVIRGKPLTPDRRSRANASTLALNGLLAPMLALLTAMAWPARRAIEYPARVLAMLPALAILLLLDTPAVLAAELWAIVLDRVAPGAFSPLVLWKDFLQSGGRQALGVAVGLLAVAVVAPRRRARRTTSPRPARNMP